MARLTLDTGALVALERYRKALSWLKRRKVEIEDGVTIDATVIATAALHGPNLYTGDFDDMQRFEGFFPDVRLFGLRTSR